MSNSNAKYNTEVSAWLKEINPGRRIIDDICQQQNKEIFIAAVKAYIDDAGYDVYFSSDYKKLRKIEILELTSKTTET